MCGVAGFFYPTSKTPDWATAHILAQMLEAIRHRGPDGQGMETGAGYGLGHVRLSIIDLSDMGAQPMWCNQKRYVLTYNGEIYNYKTLRVQLEEKGFKFRSECDTEILLYGLIAHGADFFAQLEGMFAGAFLDTQTGEAIIFRDQLGIKPLYYLERDGGIIFASEVKVLLPILGSFSLNHGAVYEQMNFRYVAGERTLYEGVKRLLPGHFMKIDANRKTNLHCYYDLKETIKNKRDFSREEIEISIRDSIHAHTMSDVGYCIQLSGGIDSTYITHVLSGRKNMLDTYSVVIPDSPDSEEEYQRIVAEKYKTNHHVFACDGEMFASLLPEVIKHLDFPVVHAGSVFLYKLCGDIAKEGHKVVLTGEGADELFLGYSRYNISRAERIAFRLKQAGFSEAFIPDLPKFRAIKSLMQREPWVRTGMYDSDIIADVLSISGDYAYRQERVSDVSSIVGQMMMSDQHAYLGSLLERQDKTSMAHGLEVRVPFCNHRLFEMINAMSFEKKTNPVPKAILKELLAQYFPHDFVYRRKNGFRIPLAEWIREEKMLGRYLDYLRDDTFHQRGIYNIAAVTQMVESHLKGIKNYGQEIFSIMSFEIWVRGLNIEE